MIEIIQNEAKEKKEQTEVQSRLRNLRQIGNPDGKLCIYLEDYVYTYLHRGAQQQEDCVGILLGKTCQQGEKTQLFISGAVGVHREKGQKVQIFLQDQTWEELYQTMKKYFDDLQIVGWYHLKNNGEEENIPELEQVQKKYFDGPEKVFYLSDFMHGEESFFVRENGGVLRKGGYYIYYEKNPQMQEYMIADQKPGYRVEKEYLPRGNQNANRGQTIKSYREMLNEQKEKENRHSHGHGFLYALTGTMAVAAIFYGATIFGGTDQMKKVEQTISVMAKEGVLAYNRAAKNWMSQKEAAVLSDETEDVQKTGGHVLVENVEGGVKEKKQEKKEDKQKKETEAKKEEHVDEKPSDVSETIAPEKEEKQNSSSQTATSDSEADHIYVVKQGDTLDSICMKRYQSISIKQQICEQNQITDADHLITGQKLILP
ncbi:MAG: LysM peptidoglycan-binding domain-containing protein [Lachnospiraceae bacterium]